MNRCWVCDEPLPAQLNPWDRWPHRQSCPRAVRTSCYNRKQSITIRGCMPTEAEAQRLKDYYGIAYTPARQRKRRREFLDRQGRGDNENVATGAVVVPLADMAAAPAGCDCHVHSPIKTFPEIVHVCEACGGDSGCRRCLGYHHRFREANAA